VTDVQDVILIESAGALQSFTDLARAEPVIAIDTEAASFHRYVDRVYLVQVSTRATNAVLDPLAVLDLEPLGALLADPDIEVIFHDADYDLRILDRDYGFRARHLFDTRIAAQLLGEPAIGLAGLLERHLGVRLTKRFQRADWSQRPLPADMISYAAADTAHLIALRDVLQDLLDERGRLQWALEEFERAEAVRWTGADTRPDPHLRIKGARQLGARERLALQYLFEWREGQARRRDRPPFRIVSNDALLGLARKLPRSKQALGEVTELPAALRSRYGPDLIRSVAKALAVHEDDLPRRVRVPRATYDPDHVERVERLKGVRNRLADELGLDSGVLCGKPLLEAIARARPGSAQDLSRVPDLRRWQLDLLGPKFLDALGN
jgi:ribonuclease D